MSHFAKFMQNNHQYSPTPYAESVLKSARILAKGETPQQMFERVVNTLYDIEKKLDAKKADTEYWKDKFAFYVANKAFTPGTPTLNNAGREKYKNAGLSSCAIIPVDLTKKRESEKQIKAYYSQNMGSGFDLTPYENPVELLYWINDLSARETATGKYERYIGNMANLHVSHPQIEEFIISKQKKYLAHFNLSVDVDDEFMEAAINRKKYSLSNGKNIDAYSLLSKIASACWVNGEPNIMNLKKMNGDNALEKSLPYTTTPPCSEMGMATGETCQFGYINLSFFAKPKGFDYDDLGEATRTLTRTLDNAIEVSLGKYPDELSTQIAKYKRKIGIAISGVADLLLYYQIPYESEGAREFIWDILSFINYVSKTESVALAEERGSCEAMDDVKNNKYFSGTYLTERFNYDSKKVKIIDWVKLDQKISSTGKLRNISTTAIPPAARVSIMMNCSQGIEPFFGIPSNVDNLPESIVTFVMKNSSRPYKNVLKEGCEKGSFQGLGIKNEECLKTAKEIDYHDHLLMVAKLVGKTSMCDETASKTVNLPNSATPEDILDTYIQAHMLGMKNIAVYRDGSIQEQPKKL